MSGQNTSLEKSEPNNKLIPGGGRNPVEIYYPPAFDAPGLPAWLGGFITLVFVLGAGIWVTLAPLDSAVMTIGKVVVEGTKKPVQHRDGGIVSEILVHDGDLVKAGDVLIRLKDTDLRAGVNILRASVDAMLIHEARLIAERDKLNKITFPPEILVRKDEPTIAELMAKESSLFNARKITIEGQITLYRQQIEGSKKRLSAYRFRQKALEKQLALTNQELKDISDLSKKGYEQAHSVLNVQRNAASAENQLGDVMVEIAASESSIQEIQLSIETMLQRRAEEIAKDIQDTQNRLNDAIPRLTSSLESLGRVDLKAPVNGYIMSSTILTLGQVIRSGETVMFIVPNKDKMQVKARIMPTDIEDVRPGMEATITLASYDMRITPTLHGVIDTVSADIIDDPQAVMATGGMGYYEAVINLDADEIKNTVVEGIPVDVQPGMPVTVSIPTRARTVIEYFLSPFAVLFEHGLREK